MHVRRALCNFVTHATQPVLANRYQSARDFAAGLRAVEAGTRFLESDAMRTVRTIMLDVDARLARDGLRA